MHYPPLPNIINGMLQSLGIKSLMVMRIFCGLLGIVGLFFLYRALAMVVSPLAALGGLAFLASSVYFFSYGISIHAHNYNLLFLGLFFWLWNQKHDLEYVRTMIFVALAVDSMFYVFCCKSLRKNLWHINPFSNKFLVGAVVISLLMLVLAVYLPPLQTLLKTVPLLWFDWLIIIGLALLNVLLIEVTKWYFIARKEV